MVCGALYGLWWGGGRRNEAHSNKGKLRLKRKGKPKGEEGVLAFASEPKAEADEESLSLCSFAPAGNKRRVPQH